MQRTIITGLLMGSAVLSGCTRYAEAPQPTHFPSQEQQKLQAASHWQLIAEDAATQLIKSLPDGAPLHVRQGAGQSPFEQAFTTQLVGILSASGHPVMKTADRPGTLLVEVSANPLRFSQGRQKPRAAGELTTLAGGLWVLRNLYSNVSPGAAMMGGAVALDAANWFGSRYAAEVPQSELIVTTSVSSDERYYAQTSTAYYTTDADWGLYARSAVLPVKGGSR